MPAAEAPATAATPDPPPGSPPEESICTSCALCCNGSLFATASLEGHEVASARELGLPVLAPPLLGFSQPCPKLVGQLCSIYDRRPAACRRYKCQLLMDLEAGKTSLPQARAKVARGQEMLAAVRAALPSGMGLGEARSLAKAGTAATRAPPVDPQLMPLKLNMLALMLYLDKHFRNHSEGRILNLTMVGNSPEPVQPPATNHEDRS